MEPMFEQLGTQIDQMLLLLSEKEKHVIEKRFDLNNTGRQTLEDIGQHYNVTRERIRQIEKTALSKLKRNIENFILKQINDAAYDKLNEEGGICKADLLVSHLISEKYEQSRSSILLVLSLDKRFEYSHNTIHYYPYFKINTINEKLVDLVCENSRALLKKRQSMCEIDELAEKFKTTEELAGLDLITVSSILSINKSFKIVDKKVGLMEWRQINPRTLRDKIYYILRKSTKPLHFVDISNSIISESFDRKNVNMQAVHNELIRHQDFVLIGRGIYALKEWGYDHGTVADILIDILSKYESLSEADIISEVMKQRKVKPITIMLNLKNKENFIRVGRKQYALANKANV